MSYSQKHINSKKIIYMEEKENNLYGSELMQRKK